MSVDIRTRYQQIQRLRAQGLTSPQIAERLGVSAEVVRWTAWKVKNRLAMDEKPPVDPLTR